MSASEDSAPGAGDTGTRRRTVSRDSARLALGSAVAGVLAYVFFMLASRALGAERAAPVSVLWSIWAISAAVLTFPVQHWIIRRFTADGHEMHVSRALAPLCGVVSGVGSLLEPVGFGFTSSTPTTLKRSFASICLAIAPSVASAIAFPRSAAVSGSAGSGIPPSGF